jgi:acyl-CoA dehydrogenase
MMPHESPWMDDELRILRDAARRFFEKEFAPRADAWNEQGMVDRAAWTKAGEAGLLCAEIPAEYGGAGGDYRHQRDHEGADRALALKFGTRSMSPVGAPLVAGPGLSPRRRRWR